MRPDLRFASSCSYSGEAVSGVGCRVGKKSFTIRSKLDATRILTENHTHLF